MQGLEYLWWDFHKYKSCDNILAPFSGIIKLVFLSDMSLVRFSRSPYLIRLPGESIEDDSLTSFENPRGVIWKLHKAQGGIPTLLNLIEEGLLSTLSW
jgi:hypothetical protein